MRTERKDREILRTIGRRVREIRCARGWTQAEIADRLGLADYRLVSSLENGRRDLRLSTLVRVAHALEVDLREILPPGRIPVAGLDEGMIQLVREGAALGRPERERLRRILRAFVGRK